MKIFFFGIGEIGTRSLRELLTSGRSIVGVATRPQDISRGQPLGVLCKKHGLTVIAPEAPVTEPLIESVTNSRADLIVVAGYHRRLSANLINIPRFGAINLHDSLLPAYRGPNATRWVILNGENRTGATVHIVTPRFDDGPVLLQRVVPILKDDDAASLFKRISFVGSRLLVEALEGLEAGTLNAVPQNEDQASYFGYPGDQERWIEWSCDADMICRQVRGMAPQPGAMTSFRGEPVGILRAAAGTFRSNRPPGCVTHFSGNAITVATGGLDLVITALHDFTDISNSNSRQKLFSSFREGVFMGR